MHSLELVSHHLCPYVQRAAIALAEKGVPFRRTHVDLAEKPQWFIEVSPLGKVPLLRVRGAIIFESAVILEYLEDTHGPALHPDDPIARAQHRAWIEFGSSVLNDVWAFYVAPDAPAMATKVSALREKFARLEAALVDGPYFTEEKFSLVDAAFGPVFRYWDVFDGIGDFGVMDGMPKVSAWRKALAERESVRNAVDADYGDRLWRFLRSRNSHLSSLMH